MPIIDWLLLIILALLQIFAAGHALLYKREPRAAWAWIVTCLLFPLLGPILYFLLGINRVRTRAKKLKWHWPLLHAELNFDEDSCLPTSPEDTTICDFIVSPQFNRIAQVSEAITKRPLFSQNNIRVLYNGEQAYPAMLEAIEQARESVFLVSYIFDTGVVGRQFVQALSRAWKRGVDVRVMLDGIGEFYSYPRVGGLLQKHNIPYTRFLPPRIYPLSPFINLRNHRKILVVDGRIGFTGGMNIGHRHLAHNRDNPSRVQDIHFRLTGPVANQMEQVFLEDWGFSTGNYDLEARTPSRGAGEAVCRTITVGPNQDLNKLNVILVGAVAMAEHRVRIMTPYFLPTRELVGALQSAALRGVQVDIVLPAKNNLPFIHWATRNMLWELLMYGVRVYYQPPPFSHAKLFLVDDAYAIIGSANIDPRSLRLNFEMVLEVFEESFGGNMTRHMDHVISESREVSLEEVDSRSLPERFRDSFFWLFSPYF